MDERRLRAFDAMAPGDPGPSRIGGGAIGGKASGLVRALDLLAASFPAGRFPRLELDVPRFVVIATDVFERFLECNGLPPADLEDLPDDRIAHRFQRTDLPVEALGSLRRLVSEMRSPLAVRSSSRLEDALLRPFAGVYETKMIPNHQPSADERFRRLAEAVKLVYASTFFGQARAYREATGAPEEGMAVVVQEVVGRRHATRHYPDLSGVARSIDFYPRGTARPSDGVAMLALGLGKTIVDGGVAWTFSPARPKAPPPFASPRDRLRATQLGFWAVNTGPTPPHDPIRETEYLVDEELRTAEVDGVLRHVASTYDAASDRFVPGTGIDGPRVLDFAPLLVLRELPLADAIREVLAACRETLGQPVEIEFALTLEGPRGSPRGRLALLQVRPMVVSEEAVELGEGFLESPDLLVGTLRAMGNGVDDSIRDVVHVHPEAFETRRTPEIAAEVAALNRRLRVAGRPYLLIGFGRWGSSDPWLGIPVNWAQIAGARIIVEATRPELDVEPSQGSHFFHNLTSGRVLYLHVRHGGPDRIDWPWLLGRPEEGGSGLVRHLRLERPLRAAVDGRTGRGAIRRGAGGSDT